MKTKVTLDNTVPPPAVDPARVRRQRALAEWSREWVEGQVAAGVDGPVPAERPEPSDYNLHVPDMDADADAQDEFHERARKIMGITT